MALNCNANSLADASGALAAFSKKDLHCLLILYLYRQLNPTTDGQQIPAASLLNSASCLACGTGRGGDDKKLDEFEVWIQRQAAKDAGAITSTFNANGAMKNITPLRSLDEHSLRAIEIWLRCQLS